MNELVSLIKFIQNSVYCFSVKNWSASVFWQLRLTVDKRSSVSYIFAVFFLFFFLQESSLVRGVTFDFHFKFNALPLLKEGELHNRTAKV